MKRNKSSTIFSDRRTLEPSHKKVTFEDLQEPPSLAKPAEKSQNQSLRHLLKTHLEANQDKYLETASLSNHSQTREKKTPLDKTETRSLSQSIEKNIFEFISYDEITISKLSILQLFRNDKIFKKNELGNTIQLSNKYISIEKINQLVTANNESQIKEVVFNSFEKYFASIQSICIKDYKETLNAFNNFFHVLVLKEISPIQPIYEAILDIFKDQNGYFCRGMVLKKGSILSCLYRNSDGFTFFKGYSPNRTYKTYSEAFLIIIEEGLVPIIFFFKKSDSLESHKVSNEITFFYKKLISPPNNPAKMTLQDLESFASVSSKDLPNEDLLNSHTDSKVSPLRLRLSNPLNQSQKSDNLNNSPGLASRSSNRYSIATSASERPSINTMPVQKIVIRREDLASNSVLNSFATNKSDKNASPHSLNREMSLKSHEKSNIDYSLPSPLSMSSSKIGNLKDDHLFWMCPECLSNVGNTQYKCKCGYSKDSINLCKVCTKPSISKVCRNCKVNGLDYCEICECFYKADKGKCDICEGKVGIKNHQPNKSEIITRKDSILNDEFKKCEICKTEKGEICTGCRGKGFWKCEYCSEKNRGGYICGICSKYNMVRYRDSSSRHKLG